MPKAAKQQLEEEAPQGAPPKVSEEEGLSPATHIDLGGGFRDTFYPKSFGVIDVNRLGQEIEDHAPRAAWVASLHAEATACAARAKAHLKRVEAKAGLEIRDNAPKKPTEAEIASRVLVHPEYIEAQESLLAIEHSVALLSALLSACRDRREMIVQLAMYQRSSETPGTRFSGQ